MKRNYTAFLLLAVVLLLQAACRGSAEDENDRAAALLREASDLVESASMAQESSYLEAFQLYEEAFDRLGDLLSRYPRTPVAMRLVQGVYRVGPYTLAELREEVVPPLRLRADAEQDPLAAAHLVSQAIADSTAKALMLADLGVLYADAGQLNRSAEVLLQAVQVSRGIGYAPTRASILTRIAVGYARGGQYDQAMQIVEVIEVPGFQAQTMARIAGEHIAAGRSREAEDILRQAHEASQAIDDRLNRIHTLAEVAANYADLESEQVMPLLHEARELATGETYSRFLARALAVIASRYAMIGHFEEAHSLATSIPYPTYRSSALADIARAYVAAGRSQEAEEVLSDALSISEIITFPAMKTQAIISLAEVYQAAGNGERAIALLERAAAAAGTLDMEDRPEALILLAGGYARAGDGDSAHAALISAMESAENQSPVVAANTLAGVARFHQRLDWSVTDAQRELLFRIVRRYAPAPAG